jgi:hypothetical protein
MNKPLPSDSIRSLWQSMPTTPMLISPDEMRARAGVFRRRIRQRNMREYIAAAVVVAVFSWYATFSWATTVMWPIGCGLIVLATLFVSWMLHRQASARAMPGEASLGALIDVHRAELVRQRNALTSVWRWYLLPFAPGLVLMFADMWLGSAAKGSPLRATIGLATVGIIFIAVAVGVVLLNLLAAAWLQRMIDDLDRYKEKT